VQEFPFRIGRRDKSNHLLLLDIAVSRRSVEITRTEDNFELHDLGQRSGVLVNGGKIDGHRILQFDDVITFPNADVKITFRQPPPEPPESDPPT
jgi:pSer/pThr/pTyr-binding forkhead associated (FHA) protein